MICERLKFNQVRSVGRRIALLFFLGLLCSLLQAWTAVILNDIGFNGLFSSPTVSRSPRGSLSRHMIVRNPPGSISRHMRKSGTAYYIQDISHGLSPFTVDGLAWRFDMRRYQYGVVQVNSSGACFTLEQWAWPSEWGQLEDTKPAPVWSVSSKPPSADDIEVCPLVYEIASGWPLTSWTGSILINERRSMNPRMVWSVAYTKIPLDDPSFFPLKPRPAVILNALIYGISIYLLFAILGLTISRIKIWFRVRKDRCKHCGYEIAGLSICSECGHVLSSESSAPDRPC